MITKPRAKILITQAFSELYPTRQAPNLSLKFSGHFKEFNGNVSIRKAGRAITSLDFSLSKNFVESEPETVIGMLQHLLNKVYKTKKETLEQELYTNFIKHLTRYAPRVISEPFLVEVYEELNKEYFNDFLEQPNLVFGTASTTVLGHYNFAKDLITISTVLKSNRELLKYVLYHELLHKKHKFKTTGTRNQYHTRKFREDEKKFHDKDIEKKLQRFVGKKKIKKAFFDLW